ncbi:hypothetical protein Syn7502_01931 [Synechococcus sp. PCC 7502]|uniref:hypothetical protein n=1 Tax=Synechococcus sp. PCC 7502 TaxID=1173263 RepID=UPI00029FF6FC|nr:hypothetical protein [Synechococcus sp. PCC 7502]AFY73963.1 hypothetical protein Syn7502_01931 [Synechococcus sp. PCC 7502]
MTDRNTQMILEHIDRLEQRFIGLERQFANLDINLKTELKDANVRIDAYQKSSTQVVRMAIAVINATALVLILSPLVQALTPTLVSVVEKFMATRV